MKKLFVTAAALAAIASPFAVGVHAWADTAPQPAVVSPREQARAAMLEAHIAGLKAGLNLTTEQERNWAPLEAAIRAAAKEREDSWRQMRAQLSDGDAPSPIERMRRMSQRLSRISDELTKVADAGQPLYDSLTDSQKRVFGPLLHAFVEHAHRHGGDHMQ